GRRGRLVGQSEMSGSAIGWNVIRARKRSHRHVGDVDAVGSNVSALIVKKFILEAEDTAIRIQSESGAMMLLTRMIGGHQMFTAILDPFDWTAQAHRRDENEHILRVELATHPKPAADMEFMQVQRVRIAIKHSGQGHAIAMRYLGRAIEAQHVLSGIV